MHLVQCSVQIYPYILYTRTCSMSSLHTPVQSLCGTVLSDRNVSQLRFDSDSAFVSLRKWWSVKTAMGLNASHSGGVVLGSLPLPPAGISVTASTTVGHDSALNMLAQNN